MVSINYSASGASALRSLQATSRAMENTQTRIATGLKVASAKDNPSLWRASQALRSDISSAAGVKDAIQIAQVQTDRTNVAVGSIRKVLGEMKTLIESATADTADKALLQRDMAAYQAQLRSLIASASPDANVLTGAAPPTVTIGTDVNGAALTMSLGATNLKLQSTDATGLFDTITGASWNKATTTKGSLFDFDLTVVANAPAGGGSPPASAAASLAAMQADLAGIITKVDGLVASVGSYGKRLAIQDDFLTKIKDIQERALSSMVDADLDEESARLSALQVKQQLATAVLQLANSSQSSILKLFQ